MVGERLVLGGDVAHFSATLDDQRFPTFADDFSAQARSADRLRQLRDSGMTVVPGHDPDVLRPGPLAKLDIHVTGRRVVGSREPPTDVRRDRGSSRSRFPTDDRGAAR